MTVNLVKKHYQFYGLLMFITVFTTACLRPDLEPHECCSNGIGLKFNKT